MNDKQFDALNKLAFKNLFVDLFYMFFPVFCLLFGYTDLIFIIAESASLFIIGYCYIYRTINLYKYGANFLNKKILNLELILFIITYSISFVLGFFVYYVETETDMVFCYKYSPFELIVIITMLSLCLFEEGLIAYNIKKISKAVQTELKSRNAQNS